MAKIDPKTPKALLGSGVAFLGAGAVFIVIGATNRDLVAFLGVGVALLGVGTTFFSVSSGLAAKARKDAEKGEGDA